MGNLPLVAIATLLVLVRFSQAKPSRDPEQAPFAKLSRKELVQHLADDKKRPRAFYELARRAEPGEYADFSAFESEHYNSRLVVCPQEQPRPPIYLVLYGFLNSSEPNGGYRIEEASELFPPVGKSGVEEEQPAIQAFNSQGQVVKPFGSNNVLRKQGTLADINGDGMVERVDAENYGSDFNDATVLMVSAVKSKAEPLLTVVLNWGGDEWTFGLADRDSDGISEIEVGPRTAAGMRPKVVWKWDRAKRAYVGPKGEAGDHFRVVNGAAIWNELRRLKASGLTFPKDADAIAAHEHAPEQSPTSTPFATPNEPYRYTSLKDAPDADLFRFMAHGKSEADRERRDNNRSRLPENFWSLDPKMAALALVETNRTTEHRTRYQLAVDDREKAEPPSRCTIAFSTASARCYAAIDGHYFLRVDPDDSYLAFAGSSAAGVVFYNAAYDQPVFDMRICRLRYEEARMVARVIWWLDRVRSRMVVTDSDSNRIVSSGDGTGRLVMRVEDRVVIDRATTLWSGHLPGRWSDDFTPETFVNFAGYVIADALPARLGNTWSQFEPTEQRPSELRESSAPEYTEAERKRLHDFSERFLAWFSSKQERISLPIVGVAAQFAGNFGVTSATARLQEIEAALPPPAPPKRSFDEVSAQRSKLPHAFEIKDPKRRKRVEEQHAALDAELDAILYQEVSGSPDLLRQALAVALRKLAVANDPDRLRALAVSRSDEQQWALQCLSQRDRKRYAEALETLTRKTRGKWTRQFFAELARVDQPRAATLARELPAEKIDPLTISAFLLLRDAGPFPDETQRLVTIARMLHNPNTDWEERARAIEALVPANDPLRYPGREVDEALLKLFEPDQAHDSLTFTQDRACQALALRGRTEYFEQIAQQLEKTQDASSYGSVLNALSHLAQQDPVRFNPRLVEIVRPHLSHTNKSVPGLMWTIWGADLRGLEPDLAHLATHGPGEFEDNKARSYGGSASAVTGRFHLARKILSLWSEPDPLTRAKLLIAFTATEAEEFFRNPHPERLARMKADMNRTAGELSPDARDLLRTFVTAIDAKPDSVNEGSVQPEMIHKATALARTELRL